jgi:hypothetical protein
MRGLRWHSRRLPKGHSLTSDEAVRRQNLWHSRGRKLTEIGPRLGLVLSGELAVLQAAMFDGLSLDGLALFDDGWRPAEVGVSGRHVFQALVIALVVVVLDEGLDLAFEVAGQEIVLFG